ncbi:MAG: 2-C-methyl-D-erythritol 4-phosphate cytidylyltransferase [Oscillospiraceae bacterium]|jgi:2-C-methyl-D-erythritol 4-phosphate cytidylyltransferase|nr:2-C-methyl-D-erythritol 4-phosphate cytidylyltransferase [Oscillospiraceae bacterium]
MTTALIFAGGTGQRMNSRAKPKQFLELHGKPIILFTLEHFEQHAEIDNIAVVCLEAWIDELTLLLRRYDIEKVIRIVPGGVNGHESIYNGLAALSTVCAPDDIVLIHDGVRPLISGELISANIAKVRQCGTAITVEPAVESIIRSIDGDRIDSVPPRGNMYTAKAPQSFRYGHIWGLYQRAKSDGLATIDSAHLLSIYGEEMHTVRSTPNNIKITASADYYIFRALYEAVENQQILGL